MARWNLTVQPDRDDSFVMVLETCHHLRAEGMSWSTLFTLRAVVERSLSVNKAVFYAVNLSTQLWKKPMRAPGEET
jgi:hypothetical protein